MIHTFQASGHGSCTEIEVQPTYPQAHSAVACFVGRSSGARGLVEGPVRTLAQGGAVPRALALAAAVASVRRAPSAHNRMGRVTPNVPQALCSLVWKANGAISSPQRGSGCGEQLRAPHPAHPYTPQRRWMQTQMHVLELGRRHGGGRPGAGVQPFRLGFGIEPLLPGLLRSCPVLVLVDPTVDPLVLVAALAVVVLVLVVPAFVVDSAFVLPRCCSSFSVGGLSLIYI